jgi:ATP-dependent Lhr-like helicase
VKPSTPFERLHPALQHHIVNSLGWSALRPLQEQAIQPLLAGENVLIVGPTAGGKTEAAVLPMLSRMMTEDWRGLGLLYVCPLRALLNNLETRLSRYAGLVGRRVALWHGDVTESARRRIRRDPPDVLLTTPESLEVMLVSRQTEPATLLGSARAVVVDELYAFAGDDRGWHLLAVLARIERLAGRRLQRVGLSATIGNPAELLGWLAGGSSHAGSIVAPEGSMATAADVSLDHVGTLRNAATVIAQLHRGDKRLVFADSRARVEQLAAELRTHDVTTFVSHSSLGVDERRRAETAFAESRDCVIVATSTLELGIDVGDLDHVIQVDAPASVSAFLQRLGRTGRRSGSRRNCLFLAVSDDAFLQAAGVIQLWSEGYVEPITPPATPYHILAQQLMALALQERGIGRTRWRDWIADIPGFAAMPASDIDAVVDHMITTHVLFDEAGILAMGPEGERSFGFCNFIELFSVFTSPPLFTVLHGGTEVGRVHESSFQLAHGESPVVLLGGRSWRVTHLDWPRRTAYVEPTDREGRSRWIGEGGALHFDLCRAMRRVLATGRCPAALSMRAKQRMERLAGEYPWVDETATTIVRDAAGNVRWWTFAGLRANAWLAEAIEPFVFPASRADNLGIPLGDGASERLRSRLHAVAADTIAVELPVSDDAIDGLKFSTCVPKDLARRMLERRLHDARAVRTVLAEPLRLVGVVP